LAYYRRIAQEAADLIRPRGYLLLEVGDGQSAAVADLLAQSERLAEVQIRPDLNQIPRVVVARTAA
jgi:release factor glutamine methyltransferase